MLLLLSTVRQAPDDKRAKVSSPKSQPCSSKKSTPEESAQEGVSPAVPSGAETRKRHLSAVPQLLREYRDLFEEGLLDEKENQSTKKEILSLISAVV